MTKTETRVHELLKRNMFLKPAVKAKIKLASPAKQAEVLPNLEKMDIRQTDMFLKINRRDPNFFNQLNQKMLLDPKCRIRRHSR